MKQYSELLNHIIDNGVWVENERTGIKCKTIINYDLTYDKDSFPLVTTRKSYFKSAIAEIMGYIKGYTSAADFRAMGTKTWDANANENQAWLNNEHRQDDDDMGRVYGAQGRAWRKPEYYENLPLRSLKTSEEKAGFDRAHTIDQLAKVYNNLKQGVDDRGEIISYYNVGEFHMGCLRPCVHDYQFSLLGGKLYLNMKQRSCDVPLGLNFNMVQGYFMLYIMSQITGHEMGTVYHKIVNAHIYENQYELAKEEASREPIDSYPVFTMRDDITTLEELEAITNVNDLYIEVYGYQHHEPINYPMTA